MRILFTGGGTGGHIYPIIAVAREIQRILPDEYLPPSFWKNEKKPEKLELFYIGPKDEISSVLLAEEGIKFKGVVVGKVRRYFGFLAISQNLVDVLFKIPIGILQSLFYIFFLSPDIIFSKGGYGSLPAVISGWLLQVPIFLHESDIAPGAANRFLSRFAIEIFVSFPIQKTECFSPQKMISLGNPIRREILEGSKEDAQILFKFIEKKPIILILGGSQGAQRINEIVLQILPELLMNYEVIHQVGPKNLKDIEAETSVVVSEELKKYYHLFPFLNEQELKGAYAAADLIISRAGSGSIFEISATGKPSILIPLPSSAQDHQIKNAYVYAEAGAALVIEQANLTPHFFLEKLKYLFSHPDELEEMAKRAGEFSRPRAAQMVAEYLIGYLFQ